MDSCKHYRGSTPRLAAGLSSAFFLFKAKWSVKAAPEGLNTGPPALHTCNPPIFSPNHRKRTTMIIATTILAVSIVVIVAYPTIEDYFHTGRHRATPHEN